MIFKIKVFVYQKAFNVYLNVSIQKSVHKKYYCLLMQTKIVRFGEKSFKSYKLYYMVIKSF